MTDTFFWYDLETTGTDSQLDRIVQFAGQRTDAALNPIGAPINFYIKPSWDTLFHPEAALVTGISPRDLDREGLSELEGLTKIYECFSEPGTCVVGYNSFKFDDEFIRQGFYRNFFDPYGREWQHGNSRWDLIQLARFAYALRPDGIRWPETASGRPSFKLEDLAEANGLLHEQAHDALSDIHATIGLAKQLQRSQPKLFDYHYKMRRKHAVLDALYPLGKQAVLLTGGYGPVTDRTLVPVLPLMPHPVNANSLLCIDLRVDPSTYLDLSAERLIDRFMKFEQNTGEYRLLHQVQINRCPPFAPISTLPERMQSQLSWQVDDLAGFVKKIQSTPKLHPLLSEAMSAESRPTSDDVDCQLYSGGFVSAVDQQQFARARQWVNGGQSVVFTEERLNELFFRFRARHDATGLVPEEHSRWIDFLRRRWINEDRLLVRYRLTLSCQSKDPANRLLAELIDRLQRQAASAAISLD